MAAIQIDFRVMTYIVLGLFALIGFSRGWLREAFTTVLLMGLVIMLAQPELAKRIMVVINAVLKAFLTAFAKRIPDPSKLEDLIRAINNIFNIQNPYGFMILVTLVLILISYTFGRRALAEGRLAPLSRLLGGTLGALNGFIVLSLLREYLLARLGIVLPSESVRAAEASRQVTVGIKNVPAQSLWSGFTPWILLALGFVVFVFFIREVAARRARPRR